MAIQISEILRSRRRTISIEVKDDARVVVRAPYHARAGEIDDFVGKKGVWISRAVDTIKKRQSEKPCNTFSTGESYYYLGEGRPLLVEHGGRRALVFNGSFILSPDHRARAKEFFTAWYREEASRVIRERLEIYSLRAGLDFTGVKITGAAKRWGSCARSGDLTFTWRLVMAPLEVIDYVVVHELSHLKEMNHSRRFWANVEALLPEYKRHRAWLKENGHRLTI